MPMKRPLIAAILIAVVGAAVMAQKNDTRASDSDWPMYSRDLSGSRFSPLADIDTGNVSQLTQAWSVQLTTPGGRRGGGAAPTPAAEGGGQGPGRGVPPAGRGGGAAAGGADDGDGGGTS